MRASALLIFASMSSALAGDAEPPKAPAPDTAAAAAPAPARTPDQVSALRKAILDGFADVHAHARTAAADLVIAAWPDTAPILDEALVSKDAGVRLEAATLLGRDELGDMRDRIRRKFADADDLVRRQAVRAARHLEWPEVEPALVAFVARDGAWIVRQEALRGLLDHGTVACLRTVLNGWHADKDDEHRARYKRILVKLLGSDLGDDTNAWLTAIEKAESKARAAKK